MKVDQCLFGYDDGHRLLVSSLPLGVETSLLTELSDLAPGTVFSRSEGYWTGLPVPSLGRYVLMRTWPATEMPRPGCVWTHALLIEPVLLESISDLSILQTLVIRPESPLDRDRYREQVEVNLSRNAETSSRVDDEMVRKLIALLYDMTSSVVEITSPGELDGPLFSVWSQQWPRLRRNFRFQTAASRDPRPTGSARFDVTAVLAHCDNGAPKQETIPSWLYAAAADIQGGSHGSLRSFLWLYGQDVRRQRGSFRPLVEVKALDLDVNSNSTKRVIDIVTDAFPTLDDAMLLKQDLVNGVLVAHEHAELIRYMVLNEETVATVFPPPTATGIAKLAHLWPKRPDEILQIAEITVDTVQPIGRLVFEAVIEIVQTSKFWFLSRSYPRIRKHMLQIRPDFFIDSINKLDDSTLIELLPLVSSNTTGLIRLIAQLLTRENTTLINVAFDQFLDMTAKQVISAINSNSPGVAKVWLGELIRRPKLLLQTDIMILISRTSLLYELADALGWLTPVVTAIGVSPWNAALIHASSDLPDSQIDTLNCFLVVLALISGGDSGLSIIERFYDDLHRRILKSSISLKAQEILLPWLPDVGWNWDLGLRFRVLVATTYINYEWSPQSYAKLTHDKKSRDMLADAALKVSGGYSYFKAVSP